MSDQKIYEQMGAIMSDVVAIGKNQKNQGQNFMFRGIDAVMDALHPIFSKHGVFILPEVLEDRTEERQTKEYIDQYGKQKGGTNLIYRVMRIKWQFVSAVDGSSVESVNIGEGMDSGDKAANKAMAISLKYALTQMLLLPYNEIDPDSETHEPLKPVKIDEKPPRKPQKPREQETNSEAWVEACKADRELATAFKDAGLSAEDGRKLWAETTDDQKLSKTEQFEIKVTEIRNAKKESK